MKLIALVGCSASAKDTVLNIMVEDYNLKPVVSHTTRPMREGEIQGREYHFITTEDFVEMAYAQQFIETREYDTKKGFWFYGLNESEIDENSDNIYVVVVDVNGFFELKKRFGERITGIYIDCPLKDRLERSFNREPNLDFDGMKEILRRQLSDMEEIESQKDIFEIQLYNDNSFTRGFWQDGMYFDGELDRSVYKLMNLLEISMG